MNHDVYIIMIGAFSMRLLLQAINKLTLSFFRWTCCKDKSDYKLFNLNIHIGMIWFQLCQIRNNAPKTFGGNSAEEVVEEKTYYYWIINFVETTPAILMLA